MEAIRRIKVFKTSQKCNAEAFIFAERLKEERLKEGLTQKQLSTLHRIFEGLGKRVSLAIL